MRRLVLAVVCVGHLGKEHARILSALPEIELVGVVDTNLAQASVVAERCGTRAFNDYRPLLDEVDGAVVVVPTTSHYDVASEFLRHSVPLLVDHPLAATSQDASELLKLAATHGVALHVVHIDRFTLALEDLRRRRR